MARYRPIAVQSGDTIPTSAGNGHTEISLLAANSSGGALKTNGNPNNGNFDVWKGLWRSRKMASLTNAAANLPHYGIFN